MEFIEVDGSQGEGGGQILRTAVAFSVILGKPVRVDRIRSGREVPGLKRQHLSVLEVFAEVFGGTLTGATVGSSEVTFVPGKQRTRAVSLEMGTAASITLVLQAVVPAVALTRSHLSLELSGGTDVPWSPTFDYFERVARKAYESAGISFRLAARRRGYYPRGGGRATASIEPCASLSSLHLTEPPEVPGAMLVSRCASLPAHVAGRQFASAAEFLERSGVPVLSKEISNEEADSPGSSVLVYHVGDSHLIGADGIGARGRPAEEVGRGAASKFVTATKSGGCLDENLADMVLPLMALAPRPSEVSVPVVTSHLESGMRLASQFTGCRWSAEARGGSTVVRVTPGQGR